MFCFDFLQYLKLLKLMPNQKPLKILRLFLNDSIKHLSPLLKWGISLFNLSDRILASRSVILALCIFYQKKKNFAHMPLVNPDRNSEVWYLVKYIQYKNKNKQKPPSPKPRGLYELHIFFWLLIKVFNISLPQNRGHILWQVVVTMGQTAWSTTAWIVLDMEITLDSTVKSSHLSPTYRTIERTHSY